jgi:hypothetical protein
VVTEHIVLCLSSRRQTRIGIVEGREMGMEMGAELRDLHNYYARDVLSRRSLLHYCILPSGIEILFEKRK